MATDPYNANKPALSERDKKLAAIDSVPFGSDILAAYGKRPATATGPTTIERVGGAAARGVDLATLPQRAIYGNILGKDIPGFDIAASAAPATGSGRVAPGAAIRRSNRSPGQIQADANSAMLPREFQELRANAFNKTARGAYQGDTAAIPGVQPDAAGDPNGGFYDKAASGDVIGQFNGRNITKAQSEAIGGGIQVASSPFGAGGQNPNLFKLPDDPVVEASPAYGPSRRGIDAAKKNIDATISALGPANTPSKRALLGNLVAQRNDLEKGVFDTEAATNQLNARLESDASATTAGLRDRGLARRQDAEQFAQEFGLKQQRVGDESKNAAEYLKMLQDDAKARRDADQYDLSRGGVFEDVLAKRADALRKAGTPEDQIAVDAAKTAARLGVDPNAAPTSAAGAANVEDRVRGLYDPSTGPLINVWGLGDAEAPGSAYTANSISDTQPIDFSQIERSTTPKWRQLLLGAPQYRFAYPTADGGKEVRYTGDAQLYNDVAALSRRSR